MKLLNKEYNDVVFYNNIPKSYIVYSKKTDELFDEYKNDYDIDDESIILKIKGYKLYKKYIEMYSEFQINIPYEPSNKFNDLMITLQNWINLNINKQEIFDMFLQISLEMRKLMKHSLNRFVNTEKGQLMLSSLL